VEGSGSGLFLILSRDLTGVTDKNVRCDRLCNGLDSNRILLAEKSEVLHPESSLSLKSLVIFAIRISGTAAKCLKISHIILPYHFQSSICNHLKLYPFHVADTV
jgi:hypothetical protein